MPTPGVLYFELSDAARLVGVSTATIKRLAAQGKLRVAAKTARGSRLFHPQDVELLRRQREARSA